MKIRLPQIKKLSLKLFALIICYTFSSQLVLAQDKILAFTKGKVEYQNSGNMRPVKESDTLLSNGTIKLLESGSEVLLINKEGYKILKGKYISALSEIIFKPKDKNMQRFVKGLSDIFFKQPEKGETVITKGGDHEMLFPADGEIILGDTVRFEWKRNNVSNSYILISFSPYEGNFLCQNESINTTQLSLPNILFCPELKSFDRTKTYIWSATEPGNTQSRFTHFSFALQNTVDSLKADLNLIEKSKGKINEETYFIYKIACYVNYKMYSEANMVFKLGRDRYPNSILFKEGYKKFEENIL